MPENGRRLPSDIAERVQGAFLAAAAGDALGWPVEPRGNKVGGTKDISPQLRFIAWDRREGGRYAPFVRHVPAGSYSDDTQLTLAVARSLLRGDDWWRHLTELELPVWTLYELGGGGAVRSAAKHWEAGVAPWSSDLKPADRRRYFEAGGNGAVMRVLPHAVYAAGDHDFSLAAVRIVADGLTTHGHPRALLGALAGGYAMWRALRWDGKFHYGELITETFNGKAEWTNLPDVAAYTPDWRTSANDVLDADYSELWARTAEEMFGLLLSTRDGMDKGSLARDSAVFEELGVYSKEGSAGTRTAAAALYLSSRYAAQPSAGLLAAAFARNTDTDTVAAVTGALLGAMSGSGWLGSAVTQLQDSEYVRRLAARLLDGMTELSTEPPATKVRRRVHRELDTSDTIAGSIELPLPVFGRGRVVRVEDHETQSPNTIRTWWFDTLEGQTLALTRMKKLLSTTSLESDRTGLDHPAGTPSPASPDLCWAALLVSDIPRATRFYRDVLGLRVVRETDSYVRFGESLILQQAKGADADHIASSRNHPHDFRTRGLVTILIDSPSFDHRRKAIMDHHVVLSHNVGPHGARRFRVYDPDSNVVEIREFVSRASRD